MASRQAQLLEELRAVRAQREEELGVLREAKKREAAALELRNKVLSSLSALTAESDSLLAAEARAAKERAPETLPGINARLQAISSAIHAEIAQFSAATDSYRAALKEVRTAHTEMARLEGVLRDLERKLEAERELERQARKHAADAAELARKHEAELARQRLLAAGGGAPALLAEASAATPASAADDGARPTLASGVSAAAPAAAAAMVQQQVGVSSPTLASTAAVLVSPLLSGAAAPVSQRSGPNRAEMHAVVPETEQGEQEGASGVVDAVASAATSAYGGALQPRASTAARVAVSAGGTVRTTPFIAPGQPAAARGDSSRTSRHPAPPMAAAAAAHTAGGGADALHGGRAAAARSMAPPAAAVGPGEPRAGLVGQPALIFLHRHATALGERLEFNQTSGPMAVPCTILSRAEAHARLRELRVGEEAILGSLATKLDELTELGEEPVFVSAFSDAPDADADADAAAARGHVFVACSSDAALGRITAALGRSSAPSRAAAAAADDSAAGKYTGDIMLWPNDDAWLSSNRDAVRRKVLPQPPPVGRPPAVDVSGLQLDAPSAARQCANEMNAGAGATQRARRSHLVRFVRGEDAAAAFWGSRASQLGAGGGGGGARGGGGGGGGGGGARGGSCGGSGGGGSGRFGYHAVPSPLSPLAAAAAGSSSSGSGSSGSGSGDAGAPTEDDEPSLPVAPYAAGQLASGGGPPASRKRKRAAAASAPAVPAAAAASPVALSFCDEDDDEAAFGRSSSDASAGASASGASASGGGASGGGASGGSASGGSASGGGASGGGSAGSDRKRRRRGQRDTDDDDDDDDAGALNAAAAAAPAGSALSTQQLLQQHQHIHASMNAKLAALSTKEAALVAELEAVRADQATLRKALGK
jgi:hypothetical protein